MEQGLTFGDLSANDRNLISTNRNIFDQMDTELKNQTRSTTDSQKNENSTERFELEKQTNIVTDKESKSSLELTELNCKNSALSDKWNNWREISSRSTLNFPDFTNYNSSCRKMSETGRSNKNNSAGSEKEISTQTEGNNPEVFKLASTQSDAYLSVVDSQENLNSTHIQTTSSLTELTPKPQRNSKKRKIDEFFQKEDTEISDLELNVNTQQVLEVTGKDNSTQTSTGRIADSPKNPISIRNVIFSTNPRQSVYSSNSRQLVNSGIQTDENSIEARRIRNQRIIKGLEEEIDLAMSRVRISDSTNFLDLTMTPDSTSQRITVPIYPPALEVWKQLRSLQTRKIILEVRTEFYRKIRIEGGVPDWAVMFNPPHNLLQTERAVESTIGFRAEMAKQNLQMLEDLFCEENSRISAEINASMASLHVHYDTIESAEYDLGQATDALNRFMSRAQQQEYNSLSKKYNSIMQAPRAALWKNLPNHIRSPPNAIPPHTQGPQPGTSSGRMTNSTARMNNSTAPNSFVQNFQGPVRRDWQLSRGRVRGRGRGGRGRGQGRVQKYNSTNQKDPKKTLRQMMDFLFDQM